MSKKAKIKCEFISERENLLLSDAVNHYLDNNTKIAEEYLKTVISAIFEPKLPSINQDREIPVTIDEIFASLPKKEANFRVGVYDDEGTTLLGCGNCTGDDILMDDGTTLSAHTVWWVKIDSAEQK